MANLTVSDQRNTVLSQITQAAPLVQALLPKHVNFDQLMARIQKHLREQPALLECTPASLFWGFVHAAEIGLSIGDLFGEGYLLPFGGKDGTKRARFIPGYKGLLKLAYQSSLIASVDAYVIYENDTFVPNLGRDENPVEYVPYLGAEHPGAIKAVYTRIKLTTGATKHDIVPFWKLEQIRKSSPGLRKPDSPWNTHPDEMYRKTGLRHALKDAPKSNEMDRALRLDDRSDSEDESDVTGLPGFTDEASSGRVAQSRQRVQANAKSVVTTDGHTLTAAAQQVEVPMERSVVPAKAQDAGGNEDMFG